ncbi:MAG: amino acid ABC transporter substrate-binding protein [Synechococcaceae cyanobacterium SM2_3_2]|nr:amino acid ABC transporter substrate-binding protein [Synechococcaceae cyanobacterium SM2_3_2]
MQRRTILMGVSGLIAALTVALMDGIPTMAQTDDSLQTILDSGKFTYGLEAQYRPFEFRDENNQIIGFDIDLANEIAERWGVEAEPIDTDWATVIQTLYNGGFVFILGGMTGTEARYERVNFSVPYMDASSGLIVKAGSGIAERADLDGLVVAAGAGTPSVQQLEITAEELGIAYDGDIRTFDNDAIAYEAMQAGRIDAYASSLVSLNDYAQANEGFEVIPFQSDRWAAEYTVAAFQKEDEALRQRFNETLLEIREDGTLDALQEKWFGRTFGPLPEEPPTW